MVSVQKGGETKKGGRRGQNQRRCRGSRRRSTITQQQQQQQQVRVSTGSCRRFKIDRGVASVVRTMVAHADVETEAWPVQQGRRRSGGRSERGGDAADGKGREREAGRGPTVVESR